ncbi:MAG TPA: hypothetical protein VFS48_06405 [Solirubrobacterales bacterium]|nr:hypothetical protein [Solirubrobacterales bacterium]
MTAFDERPARPATLPELEHLLLRTARSQTAPRRLGRRWVLALVAGSLILAAGAAAAATGVIHISSGHTAEDEYSIDTRPAPAGAPPGSICLQLRYDKGGPAFRCGQRPTAAEPFGLVVADTSSSSRERVIYGLVSASITRVSVLGQGRRHIDVATRAKPNLPGRFFSVIAPNRGRIELIGYDAMGRQRAHVGSRKKPAHPPRSFAEARAQGDPAGFAPAVAAPASFIYKGASIAPAQAAKRGLACLQDRSAVRCYDSLAQLEATR